MKFTARHLFRGHGRHRAPRLPGQLVEQRIVNCPACGVETAATVHGQLVRCAEGHEVGGAA
ncbi:hypothetical protein [Streptomyces sp. NPDC008240]|uniref:hypothetical protein n=1 Tax=Streptomyces sp. NPDC008240 TaxID=3364822 RepID=UPI0036E39995